MSAQIPRDRPDDDTIEVTPTMIDVGVGTVIGMYDVPDDGLTRLLVEEMILDIVKEYSNLHGRDGAYNG